MPVLKYNLYGKNMCSDNSMSKFSSLIKIWNFKNKLTLCNAV